METTKVPNIFDHHHMLVQNANMLKKIIGGSNMFYPDFSNGSEDPEGSTLLTGSSSVDSKSNVKTPANKHGPFTRSPVGSIRANTCVIVGDENGATIEATLPWYVNLSFGINLEEGAWFEINDFKLMHAFALIRPTKNKYHISITRKSFFSTIQTITDSKCRLLLSIIYSGCFPPPSLIFICLKSSHIVFRLAYN
ncbi:hypothetical protein YC2023_013626 [Brassica napus]